MSDSSAVAGIANCLVRIPTSPIQLPVNMIAGAGAGARSDDYFPVVGLFVGLGDGFVKGLGQFGAQALGGATHFDQDGYVRDRLTVGERSVSESCLNTAGPVDKPWVLSK